MVSGVVPKGGPKPLTMVAKGTLCGGAPPPWGQAWLPDASAPGTPPAPPSASPAPPVRVESAPDCGRGCGSSAHGAPENKLVEVMKYVRVAQIVIITDKEP